MNQAGRVEVRRAPVALIEAGGTHYPHEPQGTPAWFPGGWGLKASRNGHFQGKQELSLFPPFDRSPTETQLCGSGPSSDSSPWAGIRVGRELRIPLEFRRCSQ